MIDSGIMATNGVKKSVGSQNVPATDPAVYSQFEEKWSKEPLPANEQEWLFRARQVADALAVDAVQRDKENKSPVAEVALLKHAGLLRILGPKKYGGGGQTWDVGLKAIREVAKADGYDTRLLLKCRWRSNSNLIDLSACSLGIICSGARPPAWLELQNKSSGPTS